MAFMNQDKKAVIAAQLKAVMPAGWKYSLRVSDHSTLRLLIASAPVDLLNARPDDAEERAERAGYRINTTDNYREVNQYHLDASFSDDLLPTFEAICAAMNLGNHDNSDPMTDYFDVGHYISISIGAWNKPFKVVA